VVDSAALFSETGLLWANKVVIFDKPEQTVGMILSKILQKQDVRLMGL
jgi:hypothetical protein